MIEFILPIKTVNEANGSHGHWRVKANRRRIHRNAASAGYRTAMRGTLCSEPRVLRRVTLTRMSAGVLDDDNLRVSLKAVRDGIADALGMADNDPRIEWEYAQEKCKRGTYGVRITITPKGEA